MMDYMIRISSRRIQRSGLQKLATNEKQWRNTRRNFQAAIKWIRTEPRLDWDALEVAGLSGETLEWKSDLFFEAIGKPKPKTALATRVTDYTPRKEEFGLPWVKRVFKLGKRIIKSLKDALLTHPWVKDSSGSNSGIC